MMTHKNIGMAVVLIAASGLAIACVHAGQDPSADDTGVATATRDHAKTRAIDEARVKAKTLEYYQEIAFDPARSGLLAVSVLAEIEADPEERVEVFKELLGKTRAPGLRNALRMVLHEIYAGAGATDEVVANLIAMLAENDTILAKGASMARNTADEQE